MSKQSYDPNNVQIIYEGILKKSPPLKSKSLFSMIAKFSCATDKEEMSIIFQKRWRKRYFVLFKSIDKPHDIHLLYFKNKPLPDSKSLGRINLENFRSLAFDVGKKLNKTNVFSIQTVDDKGNNRDYYLSANSFELMKTWVDKLVACLGLNNDSDNKTRNSVPIIPSPLTHSVRGIPRSSQIRTPVSNVHSGRSFDSSKLSVNMYQNENSLTYYNMDRYRGMNLPDTPKDHNDDDDTYKNPCHLQSTVIQIPCESSTEHSYFNLGDISITPVPKVEPSFCQMFFGNDQNFSDYNPDLKLPNIQFENDQTNLKSNESVFSEKLIDLNQNQFNNSINFQSTEHDFNFELPKRIKNDDSSSTSSCYSSTNTNSSTKDVEFANDSVSFKELKKSEPPQIPKRLNVPENPILPLPRSQNSNFALPTKPRNINAVDEASTTLNYLDATNLLLENRPILNQGFHAYPNVSDAFSAVNFDSPRISPSSKNLTELTPGLDLMGTLSFDSNTSLIVQNSKDLPLVEYSEINDARTEGLHKLNERILKNE